MQPFIATTLVLKRRSVAEAVRNRRLVDRGAVLGFQDVEVAAVASLADVAGEEDAVNAVVVRERNPSCPPLV